MKFLLDYHYSDSWADPGKQYPPAAWSGKSHEELVQAVTDYTRDTIAAMRDAGVLPDMVQIGNEITPGMLWPDGRLDRTKPDSNWQNFSDLLKAGVKGVELGHGDLPMPKICIHIDRGADVRTTRNFFEKCNQYGVPYDVVGESYYPFWHGSLLDLRDTLDYVALGLNKDVIVAEIAYNWRPTPGNDGYGNRPAPFPESPEGQRDFLDAANRIVMETPNNHGKGLFWWEPAVPPGPGGIATRGMFDNDGNVLPVITVFDKFTIGKVQPAPRGARGGRRPTTTPAPTP
jgi:arabinogalactan endo-1,4-beta-galactosidase